MIFIFLGIGLFFGIMIPTLMISAIPKLTIKILELFRIYPQGTLTIQSTTYIAGSGYYRQGKVYTFNDEKNTNRFDNGRVFGYMILGFIPVMLVISILAFFVFLAIL
jgi:hypothetical protein